MCYQGVPDFDSPQLFGICSGSIVLIINCPAYAIATNVLIILKAVLSIRLVPYSNAYGLRGLHLEQASGTSLVSAISAAAPPSDLHSLHIYLSPYLNPNPNPNVIQAVCLSGALVSLGVLLIADLIAILPVIRMTNLFWALSSVRQSTAKVANYGPKQIHLKITLSNFISTYLRCYAEYWAKREQTSECFGVCQKF